MKDILLGAVYVYFSSGWSILAVIIIRLLGRNVPKRILCLLWGGVAIFLLFPIHDGYLFEWISNLRVLEKGTPLIQNSLTKYYDVFPSSNKSLMKHNICNILYIAGMVVFCIHFCCSQIKIYKKVSAAIYIKDNIYLCDHINSSFVFGLLKPKIYISSDITPNDFHYILAHEKAHLRTYDHWWKILGYILKILYWYHPLVWLAYYLFCKDLELACDEKVISRMEVEERCNYAKTLLKCSTYQNIIPVGPIAFENVGVKERILAMSKFKELSLRKKVIFVVIIVVVFYILMSLNPFSGNTVHASPESKGDFEKKVNSVITSRKEMDSLYYELLDQGFTEEDIESLDSLCVNENGQSFGPDVLGADLVSITSDQGKEGYCYRDELYIPMSDFTNPNNVLEWQAELHDKYSYPNGYKVAVYQSDGKTRIGTFTIYY